MTFPTDPAASFVEHQRASFARSGYTGVVIGLVAGTALFAVRQFAASLGVLAATLGLLLVLPVVNLLALLAEEVRRRDWIFAGIAAAVVGLIALSVAGALLG